IALGLRKRREWGSAASLWGSIGKNEKEIRMTNSILAGIYTLTPTHCGTGQTSGAVDLPIAREPHTCLPVLPASGLKGAARSTLNEREDATDSELARCLFGP